MPSTDAEHRTLATPGGPAVEARNTWRPFAILALAGANLTLVQFVAMKEFAARVGSNELVMLLVVAGMVFTVVALFWADEAMLPWAPAIGAGLCLLTALPFAAVPGPAADRD